MKRKNTYCSDCGRELQKIIVPAEKVRKFINYYFGYRHVFNKFDSETGVRQYASYYKCPKYGLWGKHDSYEDEAKLVKYN